MLLAPAASGAQSQPPSDEVPDFTVLVVAVPVADFTSRVARYDELRGRLAGALPAVAVSGDVRLIQRGTRSLAKAIRQARRGAARGEFFTSETSAEFRRVLARLMTASVWTAIMEDNPGAFRHHIDSAYPAGKTHSTVPGVVLAHLPPLPADIEYRFLGPHLVLYDVQANTIIDRLPDAIARVSPCAAARAARCED